MTSLGGFSDHVAEIDLSSEEDDGRTRERTIDQPPDSPENALTDAELDEKYRRCAGYVLGEGAVESSLDAIRNLERLGDAGDLLDHLTPA